MQAGTLTDLTPLERLYDRGEGEDLPLPKQLAGLYGRLALPSERSRPYVIANFVQSVDGVTALGIPGTSGGQISGFNAHDRMVMGILRAIADVVVVGAGTARSVPDHLWTPEYVFPELAGAYAELRERLGRSPLPLNVIVTARGDVDASQRVFQGEVPVLVLTTADAGVRLEREASLETSVVRPIAGREKLSAAAILGALQGVEVVLLEGGPHLMGDFFAEGLVDEMFLTVSPLVAGRDGAARPGFVAGRELAPGAPAWGELISVSRADNHLFLRYAFGGQREGRDQQK